MYTALHATHPSAARRRLAATATAATTRAPAAIALSSVLYVLLLLDSALGCTAAYTPSGIPLLSERPSVRAVSVVIACATTQ
jgi:hypothetical protein